jgi:hypothetical protein
MSVDSWQPAPTSPSISEEQVEKLLKLTTPDTDLTPELEWIQPFAQLDKKIWLQAGVELKPEQLVKLIKLFTLCETQGNWSLGEKSAVIPLFKLLKKQTGIDRELVQWIKQRTDNKYLPFGPLM